jgi:hypothetical protein
MINFFRMSQFFWWIPKEICFLESFELTCHRQMDSMYRFPLGFIEAKLGEGFMEDSTRIQNFPCRKKLNRKLVGRFAGRN